MQLDYLKRRQFIALLGSAAVARPLMARAQQPRIPVVGVIRTTSSDDAPTLMIPFMQGLRGEGFVEGQNVTIDFRAAENVYDRLPIIVADLVAKHVDVIVTTGAVSATVAAKAATSTIPIVFVIGSDPIENGLVKSLNRPEGNVTGVMLTSGELIAKRLQMLQEIVPGAGTFGFLVNPNNPNALREETRLRAVASGLGLALVVVSAAADSELEDAFSALVRSRIGGFVYSSDVFFQSRAPRLVELAARHRLPGMYTRQDAVAAGGLVAYGSRPVDTYRTAGIYAGRILKGAKPADLPVQQPTHFQLFLNLKTAKALGLEVPTSILLRADEVIE
jgi:putative ABC transport system substrate-binding protein